MMNKEDTKQAILGFTEFFKGITGNQDLKIPDDIAKKYGIEQDYDVCYETGVYNDQICEFCPHKTECSGYEDDEE